MGTQPRRVPQPLLPRGFKGRITIILTNIMHGSIHRIAAEALALQPDDEVLDVGCGGGAFLKKYASHVHSVAGVDYSPLAIGMAISKNRGRVEEGTAEFVEGDAAQLPLAEGRFSAVVTMGSFVAFPEPLTSIKEMHRVLRPGGRAVITLEWNAEDGLNHSKEVEKHGMSMRTEVEMREMMEEARFSDISIDYAKAASMPKIMIVRGIKPLRLARIPSQHVGGSGTAI